MSKGVIQGVNIPFESNFSFRFAEVAKYITESWPIGNVYAFYIGMNKNSYNRLPDDIKLILAKLSGEYREQLALMWNTSDFMGRDFALQNNVEIIALSPEELKRWQNAANIVIDDYVKNMVSKGYPESEVRGWIRFLRERIDYWTKMQIELHIPSVTGPPEMRP
jgi:TRAP-type C4-dicarboxylate transport system substrate-binding protein